MARSRGSWRSIRTTTVRDLPHRVHQGASAALTAWALGPFFVLVLRVYDRTASPTFALVHALRSHRHQNWPIRSAFMRSNDGAAPCLPACLPSYPLATTYTPCSFSNSPLPPGSRRHATSSTLGMSFAASRSVPALDDSADDGPISGLDDGGRRRSVSRTNLGSMRDGGL